jgi:hypothetical protein
MIRWPSIIFAVLLLAAPQARALPVDVTYEVSGSAGDWTYEFTVTNNLADGEGDLYLFGVSIEDGIQNSGPLDWGALSSDLTDNPRIDGALTAYSNNWIAGRRSADITPGNSISGFKVGSAETDVRSEILFFAFATGGTYRGGEDNSEFGDSNTPGFVGTATPIPLPATGWMLLSTVGAVFVMRRRSAG